MGFVADLLIALLGLAADQAWLATVAYTSVQIMSLLAIPAAMAIAILGYWLFDIDVIISRTVVYGLLSAAFTGVYAGIVLGIGTFVGHQGGPVLTIAAAVTIALLFQPLRRRAQLFANRLVYGRRAAPYQALSDFAGDVAGQLDLTEAVDKMVTVLAGRPGPGGPRRGSGSARHRCSGFRDKGDTSTSGVSLSPRTIAGSALRMAIQAVSQRERTETANCASIRPLHATFRSARPALLARQADGPDSGMPSVPR